MRPLKYSINVTLDGCCDHREGIADEDLHRNATENIRQADALLLGRVTYQMRGVPNAANSNSADGSSELKRSDV